MAYPNYYDALEVSPSANQTEIKQAYRRLAKQFHPDSNQDVSDHHRIAGINEAYEVLGDPERRQAYDRKLDYASVRGGRQYRQERAADAQSQHRAQKQTGRETDEQFKRWLKLVYQPVNRSLCRILNTFEDQLDELAADPFDDELMADFEDYLNECREMIVKAQRTFQSIPNPSNLAAVATNLYYALNQTSDGIDELERFTVSYTEHYLHTGHELFRIAQKLRREAQAAVRDLK